MDTVQLSPNLRRPRVQTRFGRIAALSQRTQRDRSPLELELDRVTKIVAVLAVSIGARDRVPAGRS